MSGSDQGVDARQIVKTSRKPEDKRKDHLEAKLSLRGHNLMNMDNADVRRKRATVA
jgi:hypothetical protein